MGIKTIGDLANNRYIATAYYLSHIDSLSEETLEKVASQLNEDISSVPREAWPELPLSVLPQGPDPQAMQAYLGITTIGQLAELFTPVQQLLEEVTQTGQGDGVNPVDDKEEAQEAPVAEEEEIIESRPALRYAYDMEAQLNDDGDFDHEAREEAVAQANEMQQSGQPESGAGIATGGAVGQTKIPKGTTAGLHHDNSGWTSLGPHNVGGRTLAILPVYQTVNGGENKLVFYAGAASGGVWYSDDEGANWVPTEDLMPNLAVASLIADPNDDTGQTLYAGTGEGAMTKEAKSSGIPKGAGIFKSTDGWSWTQIEATKPTADNTAFTAVNSLAFTNNNNTLVAATNGGIWYSNRSTDSDDFKVWTQAKHTTNPGRVQAEDGIREGENKVSDQGTGWNGSGHVYFWMNPKTTSVTLFPYVSATGSYDMTIRYWANGNGADPEAKYTLSLIINKTTRKQLTFTNPGSAESMSENVTLQAGQNTIEFRVSDSDSGQVYIEYIEIANPRRLQAEQGTAEGSVTIPSAPTTPNGFEGGGYADLAKPADSGKSGETPQSTLTLSPSVPEAGDYTMNIRYATSGDETTNRTVCLTFKTAAVSTRLSYPKTSTEKPWAIISETVRLKKDSNTIKFEVKENDTGNIQLD
ncbi:MAG: hypothetical protein AAF485_08050, partial [Chloroflexota bacterium]